MRERTTKKRAEIRPYKKNSFEFVISRSHLYVTITTSLIQKGKAVESTTEKKDYLLGQVTPQQLLKHRSNLKQAGFVMKINDKYFHTKIPRNIKISTQRITLDGFSTDSCNHICGYYCKRMSAAEDCDGGCAKVRDLQIGTLLKEEGFYTQEQALEVCERIEKYPFIKFGFETFNTVADATYVLVCDNYRCAYGNITPFSK